MNKEVAVSHSTPVFDSPYIKEIHDLSDDFSDIERLLKEFGFDESVSMARMRIIFHNDFQMSVIRGARSFGGSEGLFEIAVYHPLKGMTGEYFTGHDKGSEVLGHLDFEAVRNYIDIIGKLSPIDTNLVPIETKLVANQNDSI